MSYKIDCPKCTGDNFYITPENGMGYCFNCGYFQRDTAITFVEKVRSNNIDEIRNFYTKMTHYYHSAIDANAYAYIKARGISDQAINVFSIGYCPADNNILYKTPIAQEAGLSTKNGTAFLKNRIVFPYFKDNVVTDIRGRAIDANPLRYLSPMHGSYYRGADWPFNYNTNGANTVIITEGEIKSIIPEEHGYATIGLPGMITWRAGFIANPKTKYIILLDSQIDHQSNINLAVRKIASHLDDPFVATLPLENASKMDIDTFILKYGIVRFDEIVRTALPFNQWFLLQRRF
jgi:hypothetical protein